MTHRLLWILMVLSVLGVSLARYENCEIPPPVEYASIDLEDDDEAVHATYRCDEGYELQGPTELLCNLDTDIWNTDPPICVQAETSNEVKTETKADRHNKRKKLLDIIEDTSIPQELVASLDMSCAQARVEAPTISNGVVLKYEARRRGERVFLVAIYACNENTEFEDADITKLYCSQRQWVGEMPSCMVLGEYTEEDTEDYDDMEPVEEEETENQEFDNAAHDIDDESNHIVPPPPPPPNQSAEEATEEHDNEGAEHSNEVPTHVDGDDDGMRNEIESEPPEEPSATDINIVVEPTNDPYTPRVLDNDCGPDQGGCDQICERLLFPGENEPRLKCSCQEGYSLDPYDYSSCHDIDECQLNNGGCEQICNNLPGSFECSCEEGLTVDSSGKTCIDIDECQVPEVIAACAGGCENNYGSYHCVPALNAREDAREETDREESEVSPANEDGDAEIVRTSEVDETATTNCPAGYRPDERTQQCIDVDECSEGTSGCEHCVNIDGSFECTCPYGFNLADDERTCVDINECEIVDEDEEGGEYRQSCMRNCVNTPGSFICTCNDNEHLAADGRTCLADMCQDLKNPQMNKTRCAFQCVDLPSGVYECICPEGYTLSDDLHNCEVVENSCVKEDGYTRCAPGTCISNEDNTSFNCICPTGYTPLHSSCQDIDECATGENQCSHDCFNTEGSYHCACPGGFRFVEGSEHQCEDIDECQSKLDLCGALQCINLPGEFKCVCADGTEPDTETGVCRSVDPCAHSKCSHACVAEGATYRCICPDGMSLDADGSSCSYPDPCSSRNNGCQHICSSENNGACSCQSGYELGSDGKSCVDIDECQAGNGGCEQRCNNLPGSYSCVCEAGFELAEDHYTCRDINECERGHYECSHDCINIAGGYRCGCPHGYRLSENKVTCVDVDECDGAAHGCSHSCINKAGSYQCTCPSPEFSLDDDGRTCIRNVDCPEGKILDTKSNECVFVDVCLSNNGGCSHICTAGLGCSCPSGLTLNWDGKTCEDIDECTMNNGDCTHVCKNTIGSYQCLCPDGTPALHSRSCASKCPAGYKQNPMNPAECIDIDECATPGICQFSCVNKEGSYECICPKGYQLRDGRECEDINECLENNGGCVGGECINHNAGFECRCPAGQQLAADRRTCEARTQLRDQCPPFIAPSNGEIHCTKYRHKKKLFYNTRCKVGCKSGYKLEGPEVRFCNATGQWDNFENQCLPASCPRLPLPRNGVLIPSICTQGIPLIGQRCQVHCHPGFMPTAKSVAICTSEQKWSNEGGQLECVSLRPAYPSPAQIPIVRLHNFMPRPFNNIGKPSTPQFVPQFHFIGRQQPFIKCPRNTTVFLNHGETTAHIILQKPLTNIDFRYIESSPPWTKTLQSHLPVGRYVVTFKGHDPLSGRDVGCETVITVRQSEAPKILFCTPSFDVTLGVNQAFRSIVWEEPRFEIASPGLKKLYKSRLPGELFGVGIHTVYYEATNAEGRSARCEFKINVKAAPPVPSVTPMQHMELNFPKVHPIQPPILNQAEKLLMPGHESFVICPGQKPVKVTQSQPVSYFWPEWLIRVRYRNWISKFD